MGAEIKGRAIAVVKALDAGEIEAIQLGVAGTAKDAPGLEDVVESEKFREVEVAIPVGVKGKEPVMVVKYPVVAVPVEEMSELGIADSAILVPVHGLEKFKCHIFELLRAVVVVRRRCLV